MNHLLLAFEVVFPLFFYMALGFFICKIHILEPSVFRAFNGMVFRILIPASLFMNIYRSDFKSSVNGRLFLYMVLMVMGIYLLLYIGVPKIITEKSDAATMIQGIYRSNYVLFGLLIAADLCKGQDIGVIGAMAAFAVPLFNILAVVLFLTFQGRRVRAGELLLGIARNPLVAAGAAAILVVLSGVRIPPLLADTIGELGNMASPVALICLGGMLSFSSVRKHGRLLLSAALGRLVIVPIIGVGVGFLLGYRNVELVALLCLFGTPTAVASAPMAYEMGGNGELAGEIVAVTSVACIGSLFLFIVVLKGLGWIV